MFNKPLTLKQIGILLGAILAFAGALLVDDNVQKGAIIMAGLTLIGSLTDGSDNGTGM